MSTEAIRPAGQAALEYDEAFALLTLAPVALFACDADGRILFAQGRDRTTVTDSNGDLIGRSVFTIHEHHPELLYCYRRALEGAVEHTSITNGTVTWTVRCSPLSTPAGTITGVVAVMFDIAAHPQEFDSRTFSALHDTLTSLAHRTLGSDGAQQVLASPLRQNELSSSPRLELTPVESDTDLPGARLAPDESSRLAALYDLQLLDTPREERFDRITRTVTQLFEVPPIIAQPLQDFQAAYPR